MLPEKKSIQKIEGDARISDWQGSKFWYLGRRFKAPFTSGKVDRWPKHSRLACLRFTFIGESKETRRKNFELDEVK